MTALPFPETADIETSSENYARRFSGTIGAWFLHVQEKATLKMLASFKHANILDVGGGHAQLAPALIQQGHCVTVLGSDESCRKRLQSLVDSRQCHFKVGNILDLPYPDESFDVVLSYRLLPHVTAWKQYIAELTRVAQRIVMVDYPEVCSVNYIAPLLFRMKKHLEGNTRSFTSFRERDLLTVFRAHGFRVIDRYPEFFFPMVLHRLVRMPRLSAALEYGCRLTKLTDRFGSPVILKLVREHTEAV